MGGRGEVNAYPKPVSSYILRNDSRNEIHFTNITAQFAPELQNIGLVCDALWTDYDNDGWQDLMLAGEWMPITILKNKQGKLLERIENQGLKSQVGFWNSISSGDFDNDGDMDYIAGNLGINTMNKVSEEFPLTIYGNYTFTQPLKFWEGVVACLIEKDVFGYINRNGEVVWKIVP